MGNYCQTTDCQTTIHSLNSYSQYELHAGAQTLPIQSYTNTEKRILIPALHFII